jgi:hypothetical protein
VALRCGRRNYLRGGSTSRIGVTDLNVAVSAGDAAESERTLQFLASLTG